jgi:hypothetical protein
MVFLVELNKVLAYFFWENSLGATIFLRLLLLNAIIFFWSVPNYQMVVKCHSLWGSRGARGKRGRRCHKMLWNVSFFVEEGAARGGRERRNKKDLTCGEKTKCMYIAPPFSPLFSLKVIILIEPVSSSNQLFVIRGMFVSQPHLACWRFDESQRKATVWFNFFRWLAGWLPQVLNHVILLLLVVLQFGELWWWLWLPQPRMWRGKLWLWSKQPLEHSSVPCILSSLLH